MLTDTKLRTLKAKAKLYRVADTNRLCIEVRTNGARIWRYSPRSPRHFTIVRDVEAARAVVNPAQDPPDGPIG